MGRSGRDEEGAQLPHYASIKRMIGARVASGDWPPGHRVPSENELAGDLGLSRMTVNRALRELAAEGVLTRVQGLGTFVAEGKGLTSVFEVRNIAEEIAGRGRRYSAVVVAIGEVAASADIAAEFGLAAGSPVFHSLIVHCEDDVPVQLEDRHVNPALAPDYLRQDFSAVTPNAYLSAVLPWTEAVHTVEAVLPAPREARLLAIGRRDPCLLIRRRTLAGGRTVTVVRLLLPGGRSRIESRQQAAVRPD